MTADGVEAVKRRRDGEAGAGRQRSARWSTGGEAPPATLLALYSGRGGTLVGGWKTEDVWAASELKMANKMADGCISSEDRVHWQGCGYLALGSWDFKLPKLGGEGKQAVVG